MAKINNQNRSKGHKYEAECAQWLLDKGVKIIEKNFYSKMGEIDLIIEDDNVLAFCEIKYRSSNQHGAPAETVTHQKQRKIFKTAQTFLMKHPYLQNQICRFDVISMQPNQIEWTKNAFQVSY